MSARLPLTPMPLRRLLSPAPLRRCAAVLAAAALTATLLTACGSDDVEPFRVGSDGSATMRVAAAIYAGALAGTGVRVETVRGDDGDRRLLDDTAQGDLDLFPAFTGDLLVTLTSKPEAVSAGDVEDAVNRALPQAVTIGDPAAVSNRRQLVVTQKLVDAHRVTDLAGCGALPAGMPLVTTGTLTTDERAAFAVCRVGPITERLTPTQVVDRVAAGPVLGALTGLEAASALTGHDDLIGLRSETSGPRAQDLVPVFRAGRVGKSQMKALSRVAGELTTAELADLTKKVEAGADPVAVADEWLSTSGV